MASCLSLWVLPTVVSGPKRVTLTVQHFVWSLQLCLSRCSCRRWLTACTRSTLTQLVPSPCCPPAGSMWAAARTRMPYQDPEYTAISSAVYERWYNFITHWPCPLCCDALSPLLWCPVPFVVMPFPLCCDALSPLLWCPVPFVVMHFPLCCDALSPLLWCPVPFVAMPCPLCCNALSPLLWCPVPFVVMPCPFCCEALSLLLWCSSHEFIFELPGLQRGTAVLHFLGLRVRIPPGAWVYFSCECCVSWVWSRHLNSEETVVH